MVPMSAQSRDAKSTEDVKERDRRVFRRIFRRMIALLSLTVLVAAIGTGVGYKEAGIVVVLLCLWVGLMVCALICERWFVRRF